MRRIIYGRTATWVKCSLTTNLLVRSISEHQSGQAGAAMVELPPSSAVIPHLRSPGTGTDENGNIIDATVKEVHRDGAKSLGIWKDEGNMNFGAARKKDREQFSYKDIKQKAMPKPGLERPEVPIIFWPLVWFFVNLYLWMLYVIPLYIFFKVVWFVFWASFALMGDFLPSLVTPPERTQEI